MSSHSNKTLIQDLVLFGCHVRHLPDKTMPYPTRMSSRVKILQCVISNYFVTSSMTQANLYFIYAEHCSQFSKRKCQKKNRELNKNENKLTCVN